MYTGQNCQDIFRFCDGRMFVVHWSARKGYLVKTYSIKALELVLEELPYQLLFIYLSWENTHKTYHLNHF